jgi:hypothetical protein
LIQILLEPLQQQQPLPLELPDPPELLEPLQPEQQMEVQIHLHRARRNTDQFQELACLDWVQMNHFQNKCTVAASVLTFL